MAVKKLWALIAILLVITIITSSIIIWSRYRPTQAIEISLPPSQELTGGVYIGGAVGSPGFYPLAAGDTVAALIQAAGGTTGDADLGHLKLYLPQIGEEQQPQRVNINRAEAWLLEALPGIGEYLAQAIIYYRQQNGPFKRIDELARVEGIGTATYTKVKDLITVTD
jgi:competence protein ComEA